MHTLPINIGCVSLNFQKLDDRAISLLSSAYLNNNNEENIKQFKDSLGFPVNQIAFIQKCNAVIILVTYSSEISDECLRGRILDTWDKLSKRGISESLRYIKFFTNEKALKYVAECAAGLNSVVVGDSQVLSQIYESLTKANEIQNNDTILSIIAIWLNTLVSEIKLRTSLFSGNTSLERIATTIINQKLNKDEKISVIGLGRTGSLVTKILSEELGYTPSVTNRSNESIERIKNKHKVNVLEFNDTDKIAESSAIVFALEPNNETRNYASKLISKIDFSKNKLLIDFGSPSIVCNNEINTIDIKKISEEAEKTIKERASEIIKTKQIIEKQFPILVQSLQQEINKTSSRKETNEVTLKLDEGKIDLIKIRNETYKSIRKQMESKDFTEITSPHIVGISTDPPQVDRGTTINVLWQDGRTAFLRQSNQIYKQIISTSSKLKIFEIGPFWRAETEQSFRHLQETIGLDVEYCNPTDLTEVYELAYSIIRNTFRTLKLKFKEKLDKLKLPEVKKVPILNYSEAIERLKDAGFPIKYGEDLGIVNEARLGQIIKKENNSDALIVKSYPDTIKKFYTKKGPKGTTETFDIIVCGWELSSGALRETNKNRIEKSMKLSSIDPSSYEFYLNSIDGAEPHGGFCIGIDRLIAKIIGLDKVSDAVVFPRTFKKLIP